MMMMMMMILKMTGMYTYMLLGHYHHHHHHPSPPLLLLLLLIIQMGTIIVCHIMGRGGVFELSLLTGLDGISLDDSAGHPCLLKISSSSGWPRVTAVLSPPRDEQR